MENVPVLRQKSGAVWNPLIWKFIPDSLKPFRGIHSPFKINHNFICYIINCCRKIGLLTPVVNTSVSASDTSLT